MRAFIRNLRPWIVVLALCTVYLLAVFLANGADARVFVTLGTRFTEGDPAGTEGYDGQFAYFIAANPLNASQHLDAPAYRYQRILLPALGRALSLGRVELIPWAFVLINLIALAGGTFLMERLLQAEGANRWYALVYGLFAGVFMSVRLSLNEPLAYGLVLAAIWLERREKPHLSAGVFALAILAKETAITFVVGYLLWMLAERRWGAALRLAVAALIPFVLWQVVLFGQFGEFGVGSGGAMATPFEIIPYNGLWRIYIDTGSLVVFLAFAVLLIPGAVIPSLWGLVRAVQDVLRRRRHPYVFLLFASAAVIPFTPFSTFREPLGMLRFITGLVIAVVLFAAMRRHSRALNYSFLWLVSLAFVVSSG